MVNIGIVGCNGRMGHFVADAVEQNNQTNELFGVDAFGESSYSLPVYKSFSDIKEAPDAIIDFSNPALLDDMLGYAVKNSVPCVICTTGYSQEQVDKIKAASEQIAIFYSGNMSLGINLLCELAKTAAKVLGGTYDIEIVETHHAQKTDAPSGTALMLADAISSELERKPYYEYDRHLRRTKRPHDEIGIHSIRGGTAVGEHEIIFAGYNETIKLSHCAQSKELFAAGAVNAAKFIQNKEPGLYGMSDMINGKDAKK